MIIWRGWGILAILVFGLVNVALGELAADQFLGIPEGFRHYRDAHNGINVFCGLLSALACWFVGTWLEAWALKRAQVVLSKETGQEIHLVSRHDLFWIPVKWWAVVWLAYSLWVATK